MKNPYKIVEMFEDEIADYCVCPYVVSVESCTAAIFLSLQYLKYLGKDIGTITIPNKTYPSIPCSIIHSGGRVNFEDVSWRGEYELKPTYIFDSALRFRRGMYLGNGAIQCLSFHVKKLLPIGRGGAILTDNFDAYEWFKKARFDGRNPVPLQEDNFTMLGWNCYMQPQDAARGLQLLQALGDKQLDDLSVESQKYADLSKYPIYTQ